MEDKKPAIKIIPNKQYWMTLDKKFGEYDNKYGKSYGYAVKVRNDKESQPTDETIFLSEAIYNLIQASRTGNGVEFELILNEKDGKKFYTLDNQTTNQWLANNMNKDVEKPTSGQDELDALFGEITDNKKEKTMLLKSKLNECIKLVDDLV
tara:strand:+ start:195 stop:647 length:453 start_codon:yes stop_codon:yes gene_type:complete